MEGVWGRKGKGKRRGGWGGGGGGGGGKEERERRRGVEGRRMEGKGEGE